MNIEAIREAWLNGDFQRAATQIDAAIPRSMRPRWAADTLALSCSLLADVPEAVCNVWRIGMNRRRLGEAHVAFSAVRHLTLLEDRTHSGGEIYSVVLTMAELCAKTIYNASGIEEPVPPGVKAPFDDDCGERMVIYNRGIAQWIETPEFKQQCWELTEFWLRRATRGIRRTPKPIWMRDVRNRMKSVDQPRRQFWKTA